MLTANELADMRDDLEDSLPDTAVIKSPAWVSDGRGGGTTTFTAAGTVVCRVAPIPGNEKLEGARVHPDSEYLFTLPFDAVLDSESVLSWNGGDFSVTAAPEPRSWALCRPVEAKEVV